MFLLSIIGNIYQPFNTKNARKTVVFVRSFLYVANLEKLFLIWLYIVVYFQKDNGSMVF
jgi:hypothetical protein